MTGPTHVRLKTKLDHYWLSLKITVVRSFKVTCTKYFSHLKWEIEQFWIGHFLFSVSDYCSQFSPVLSHYEIWLMFINQSTNDSCVSSLCTKLSYLDRETSLILKSIAGKPSHLLTKVTLSFHLWMYWVSPSGFLTPLCMPAWFICICFSFIMCIGVKTRNKVLYNSSNLVPYTSVFFG